MASIKNHPHRLEQCPIIQLENPSKWKIQGHSRAGERTGFWLTPLKIVLDAGLGTYYVPKSVLITHSHTDHCESLPAIITTRSNSNIIKGQENLWGRPIFMPETMIPKMTQLLKGIISLSKDQDDPIDLSKWELIWRRQSCHPIGIEPGQTYQIPGINNLELEILPAHHNTDSVGYGFNTIKKKLKEEYHTLTGKEIRELVQNKVEVSREIKTPEMIFYGDSNIDHLKKHDEWQKYPVIICECTGYPGFKDAQTIYQRHHTHLDDLLPFMRRFPKKQWVLIHASMMVPDQKLRDVEENLRNVENFNIRIISNS